MAGVSLADSVGLAAFSMNKLAGELGTAPMSLYRYVESRDELLVLMRDAGFGPVPATAPPPDPWRAGLTFWARRLSAIYLAHPWMLQLQISGLPRTPNALAWVDYGLQCLACTDLDGQAQLNGLLLLDGHIQQTARLTIDRREARRDGPPPHSHSAALGHLVREERFPALARLIASGAADARSAADTTGFEFGLERILDSIDGLTNKVTQRSPRRLKGK